MDILEDGLHLFFGEDSAKPIHDNEDDCGESVGRGDVAANMNHPDDFWESQLKLVEQFLSPRSLHELSLKRHVSNALQNLKEGTCCSICACHPNRCTTFLREIVANHLQRHGYRAAICRSEWKASKNIPKGRHEYIEVIIEAAPYGKEARYIIDLDFRTEFEVAKSSNGYRKIVDQLPEVYVGKPERLRTILRAVCEAMKRSSEENKMHMGPWRKFGFMQMKWLGPNVKQVYSGSHMGMVQPSGLQRVPDNLSSREPLSRIVFFSSPLVKSMV